MKKIYANKKGKRTGVKQAKSNKAKFHRNYKAVKCMTVGEPGPSKAITFDEDGKVTGFIKWAGNATQASYTTKVAKEAMDANKGITISKKSQIKDILMKAGYDPTIRYTRKEKKKFTRIVKNELFRTPKPVTLTNEQVKEIIVKKKEAKKARFEALPYEPLPIVVGKQRGFTLKELTTKETPKERKFRYSVQRKRSDDAMRTYDYLTDYFNASTRAQAKAKAKEVASKYKADSSFAGITVQDIEGDQNIIYYRGADLLAA